MFAALKKALQETIQNYNSNCGWKQTRLASMSALVWVIHCWGNLLSAMYLWTKRVCSCSLIYLNITWTAFCMHVLRVVCHIRKMVIETQELGFCWHSPFLPI
jgi:hypothetical protein